MFIVYLSSPKYIFGRRDNSPLPPKKNKLGHPLTIMSISSAAIKVHNTLVRGKESKGKGRLVDKISSYIRCATNNI